MVHEENPTLWPLSRTADRALPPDRAKDAVPPGGKALVLRGREEDPPRDGVVRKCTTTIHIAGVIKLWQRRAFNFLLYAALPGMRETTQHRVTLNALLWYVTGDVKVSRHLRRFLTEIEEMMTKKVIWDSLSNDCTTGTWTGSVLLPYVKIDVDNGLVDYEFTRAFQDRVYGPAQYVDMALSLQLTFRSVYALTLYEHVRYYLAEGYTPWLTVNAVMRLLGVDDGYYSEYTRLLQKVVKPALKAINEKSDITVTVENKRDGRGPVTEIRFQVCQALKNKGQDRIGNVESKASPVASEDLELRVRMADFAVTEKQARAWMAKYSAPDILGALDAADAWISKKEREGTPVTNKAGAAYRAITDRWTVHEDVPAKAAVATSVTPLYSPAKSVATEPMEPPKPAWSKDYLDTRLAPERDSIITGYEHYLACPEREICRRQYRSHGFDSRSAVAELTNYLHSIGVQES